MKPEIGDLIRWFEHFGFIEDARGVDIKVRWLSPLTKVPWDKTTTGYHWLKRNSVHVLSKAQKK